jgi:hypothetical protein
VTVNGEPFSLGAGLRNAAGRQILAVISNTSATAIDGTCANLADGAILTAAGNNFQANYEVGDGNDLTLTVVP